MPARPLRLEWLEDRTLPAGHTLLTATPLPLAAGHPAAVSGYLDSGRAVDLYALTLAAGDTVQGSVAAQGIGSTLDGVLRVFGSGGQPIASNDNFDGLDPRLAFQAPAAGTYYVGVSSAGDALYDPNVAPGDQGSSLGTYRLQLSLTHGPLLPDVVGASFHVVGGEAAWGDTVTVDYTLENRGGAATPGPFDVDVALSADNRIDAGNVSVGSIQVPGLAAGASLTGSLPVELPGPDDLPAGFTEPGPFDPDVVFLGLRFNSLTEPGRGTVPSPNVGQRQGTDLDALQVLLLRTATPAATDPDSVDSLPLNTRTIGTLTLNQTATFEITLPQGVNGRLIARVPNVPFFASLSLIDQNGTLAFTEGGLPGEGDPSIDQELNTLGGPATYFLQVQNLGQSDATDYTLTAEFQPSNLPTDPFLQDGGANPVVLVAADFNGDGLPDLAQADAGSNDVQVVLGAGADTFRETAGAGGHPVAARSYAVGAGPSAMVVGDFNGDGIPDLAVTNSRDNDVSILLGNGDGTFHEVTDAAGEPLRPAAGPDPGALVVGDFNGDGVPDLAVADGGDGEVTVLLGNGDGTFRSLSPFPVATPGEQLTALAAGDFNGDGTPDLAVALAEGSGQPGHVEVLQGNGNGTFRSVTDSLGIPVRLAVGADPVALTAADLNGDGLPDLVTADSGSGTVSVLLDGGGGRFAPAVAVPVGAGPRALATGDFNNDGATDLAVADGGSGDVSVLLGNGDGTFGSPERLAYGMSPVAVVASDLDGDGSVDLVTASPVDLGHTSAGESFATRLSVLPGHGDGAFLAGTPPAALAAADFNRDGSPDLAAADGTTNDVTVYLGAGDGTLPTQFRYPVGQDPVGIATADFNGDGRPDLAVADHGSDDVTILLGLGDGQFRTSQVIPGVGDGPSAIAAGDFNGHGPIDLVVVDSLSDQVVLLPGNGDGSFADPVVLAQLPRGSDPVAVALGDFNGDGRLDVAVADEGTDAVTFLRGNGNGTFGAPVTVPVGGAPDALAAVDFDGDHRDELAVATNPAGGDTAAAGTVSIVRDEGSGAFAPQVTPVATVGQDPVALVAGDFAQPGVLDLVAVNRVSQTISFLQGQGDGTFAPPASSTLFDVPLSAAAADFNRDGRLDLALGEDTLANVQMFLGLGGGQFDFLDTLAPAGIRSTPMVADVNGDGVPDLVILDRSGNILVRLGQEGRPGTFGPPLPPLNPGNPARDLTVAHDGPGRVLLATVALAGSDVMLYRMDATGTVSTQGPLDTGGPLPTRIVAGNIRGASDGHDDLFVTNDISTTPSGNSIAVFLSDGTGGYGSPFVFGGATGPADIALTNLDGDPLLDAVIADPLSREVVAVFNQDNPLGEETFPTGLGPYASDGDDTLDLLFRPATGALVTGDFNDDGRPDLVAADPIGDRIALLLGQDSGLAPAVTIPLGFIPAALVTGDFNGDGNLDLAVLDAATDTIHVYLGDGRGGFVAKHNVGANGKVIPLLAGPGASGLTVADVAGPGGGPPDGIPDLLVGDGFGDVLTLVGNGDGTFSPLAEADTVPLVAPTPDDVVLADPVADRVASAVRLPGTTTFTAGTFLQDRRNGLLAPDALALADLNGDGLPDLVVADGGANSVLVYPGQPGGGFADQPLSFPVGTDPVGVTVSDLNGDGILDLAVSDQGSNDVAVLFGLGAGAAWTLVPGPRLAAGRGPIATAVEDVTGDGIADLVVTNGQAGTLSVLPGIGRDGTGTGFFNDANPTVINVPGNPGLRGSNGGFLVTDGGAVIDAGTLATVVPADPAAPVLFAEPFPLPGSDVPALFVTRGDGTVDVLTSATGSSYETADAFSAAGLTNPSTLDVVPIGDELDIYVTQEGSDLPVVFTLDLGIPVALPESVGAGRPEVAVLQPLGPATVPVVPSLVAGAAFEGTTAGPEGTLAGAEPGAGLEGLTGAEPEPAAEGGVAAGGGDEVEAAAVALGDQPVTPFVITAPDGDLPDAPAGRGDRQNPGDAPPAEEGSPDPLSPPRDEPPAKGPPAPQGGLPGGERPQPGPAKAPAADGNQRDNRAPEVELSRLLAKRDSLPELSAHLAVWWETGGAASGSSPGTRNAARTQVRHAEDVDARWAAYPDLGCMRDGRDEATLLAAALVLGLPLGGGPPAAPDEPPASRSRLAGRSGR
jgi:hypothetical protein